MVTPGGTLAIWVCPNNKVSLKRSLLAHYFSRLGQEEKLDVAEVLADTAHALQLTSPTYLNMFASDLNFSVKHTEQYTRHILYDGLGPDFHYLLDRQWFENQVKTFEDLQGIEFIRLQDTAVKLLKKPNP